MTPPRKPLRSWVALGGAERGSRSFRGGVTRLSQRSQKRLSAPLRSQIQCVAVFAVCAVLIVAGCGESGGVDDGAAVTIYAAAPLCAEAKRELARDGGRVGDVRVRTVCLPSAESSGKLSLALIGANARRATEDSTAIGYIGEPTRAATRFSEPILEEAGIAQLTAISGTAAMSKLLRAVDEAGDSGSLRESILDQLE